MKLTKAQSKVVEVLKAGGYIRPYQHHGRFGSSPAKLFDSKGVCVNTVRRDMQDRLLLLRLTRITYAHGDKRHVIADQQ